jgi:hypothetical protein
MPSPLTPEEFEATRKACALTIARAELVLAWREERLATRLATRAAIEHSRALMAWADAVLEDALLKGRV